MSLAATALAPMRCPSYCPRLGPGATDQALPSQCSIKLPFIRSHPTAQMLLGARAVTAYSPSPMAPEGFGLGTMLQVVPSQCSMSDCVLPSMYSPTAQTSLGARAATPCNWPARPVGVSAWVQPSEQPGVAVAGTAGWLAGSAPGWISSRWGALSSPGATGRMPLACAGRMRS